MVSFVDTHKIGAQLLSAYEHSRGTRILLFDVLRDIRSLRRYPIRRVFFKQIYFTGIEAMSKIAILGLMIGIVIITQVTNIVGMNPVLIGKILLWTVIRELGPLLAAIIIIARSSTAIASELGSMKVNHEMDYLLTMGIDPHSYLIVPRVAGTTLCVVILTFYFQVIAVIGGLLVAALMVDIPFFQQLNEMLSIVGFLEVSVSLVKSLIFGLIIATVSCYNGLRVERSITEIPQVTSFAVIQSLTMIFLADGIITLIFFL